MVKQMLLNPGRYTLSALVTIGWISFFGAFIVDTPFAVILFQTLARVLP
ncbi:hypothetical protein [Marispirochaeta sp.]|nr:hypothetical protein [Marispirochaeta sp.]